MINIAIIDNEKMIRAQVVAKVRFLLGGMDAETFVYGDGTTFLADIGEGKKFHIVISDTELNGMSGIELGRQLKTLLPQVYLVYLTSI